MPNRDHLHRNRDHPFKLSLRDLVEMTAERGLSLSHTAIMRWVQRYAPEFVELESIRPSTG